MSALFRKEVWKDHTSQNYGAIFLSTPLSNKLITAFLSFLVCLIGLFIVFGEFAKKERVRGYLTPEKGIISLVPQRAGIIIESYVQPGDDVKIGQNLFLVKVDTTSGAGVETAKNLVKNYKAEKEELITLLTSLKNKYEVSEEQLRSRIIANKSEEQKLKKQIELQKKTVLNQEKLLDRFNRLLEQQAGSSLEVFSQEGRYIEASKELGSMELQLQRSSAVIQDNQSELLLLPFKKEEELRNLSNSINSIDQRITQSEVEQNYYITAPVSGRLTSVSAQLGLAVNSQIIIGNIIPESGILMGKLLVPSRAAGFVEENQTVRLLYDAYPYQKFGFHLGSISSVPRSVIDNSQLPIRIDIRAVSYTHLTLPTTPYV